MTKKGKETAEQKLLKMIEASGGAGTGKAVQKSPKKNIFVFTVKSFIKILIIVCILSALWLADEIRAGIGLINKDVNFSIDQATTSPIVKSQNIIPTVQRLSYYLTDIKKRNLFQPYDKKDGENSTTIAPENTRIGKETAKYKLVGISWMDSVASASVMLEDTEKNETLFLKKGEKIGNVIVKTIYADSVELGYENEEIIIRYDKSQH